MHRSFVAEFAARRPAIKLAWERKLRKEPITSPLANPDTLVLLMDRTLDELAAVLAARCEAPAGSGVALPGRPLRGGCLCGLNPLLAYFRVLAGVLPAVLAGGAAACPQLGAAAFAACTQELLGELQGVAAEEIKAFCATCQTEIMRGSRSLAAAGPAAVATAGR